MILAGMASEGTIDDWNRTIALKLYLLGEPVELGCDPKNPAHSRRIGVHSVRDGQIGHIHIAIMI